MGKLRAPMRTSTGLEPGSTPGSSSLMCSAALGARVIATCDAFAAMTSPRPHAAQLPIPKAVAELRRCAGTQFDPAVVDALSELVVELLWPSNLSGAAASGVGSARD